MGRGESNTRTPPKRKSTPSTMRETKSHLPRPPHSPRSAGAGNRNPLAPEAAAPSPAVPSSGWVSLDGIPAAMAHDDAQVGTVEDNEDAFFRAFANSCTRAAPLQWKIFKKIYSEEFAKMTAWYDGAVRAAQAQSLKYQVEVEASKRMCTSLLEERDAMKLQRDAMKLQLDRRPLPIRRLDERLSSASKPEDWIKSTNLFVGEVCYELSSKHGADGIAAISKTQDTFPVHFQTYETIKVTTKEMLTSVASSNQQWPAKAAVERLGLLDVLTSAMNAVEESIAVKFLATLNQTPVSNTMPFDDIESAVVQRIESAAASAPKLRKALDRIELTVKASIKLKIESLCEYERYCQGVLATRGIDINPPKQLPCDAAMCKSHLNDLEGKLLQNAENKLRKCYERVQRAFPPNPFKTAVELTSVVDNLKKHFGDDAADVFVRRLDAEELAAFIPYDCNADTYSAQLAACRSLAAQSPAMAKLVASHEKHLEDLEIARNAGNGVKTQTDALARLQSAKTHSCTASKADEISAINQVFQQIVSNVDEGLPTAMEDLAYLKEKVNDLPKAPWYFDWGPFKHFGLSGKVDALLDAWPKEKYDQLPKVALRAEAVQWIQNLRDANAAGDVHRITEVLLAQPTHSAPADDVMQAARKCWSTMDALVKKSARKAIRDHSLAAVDAHAQTITKLKAAHSHAGQVVALDQALETLTVAARLLEQRSRMSILFDGWDVHHTVTLSPEEAKFGCTIQASRFGGLQDIAVLPGQVDLRAPDQQLRFDACGLPDFQAARGCLMLTVSVSGRVDPRPTPAAAMTFQPSQKLNKRQKKASTIVPGAVGCVNKLACVDSTGLTSVRSRGRGGGSAVVEHGAAAATEPAPVVKGQGARDAVADALAKLNDFVPTAPIIAAFARSVGCAADASMEVVGKAYGKASKRAFANVDFEFRAEDKGGDQMKAMYCLDSHKLLFPSNSDEKARQTAYDGLCARLTAERPNKPRLGASEPFREDINILINKFMEVNAGSSEVAPVTRSKVRHSTAFDFNKGGGESVPTHSSTKIHAGAGEQHQEHPWRGDVVEEIVVSDTAECTINGTVCTVTRQTLPWDLQVVYTLSAFEACVGSVALHLEHPDGETYCMDLQAAACSTDGSVDMFAEGQYVCVGVGLGAATSTGGRGDLSIVLKSSVQAPKHLSE